MLEHASKFMAALVVLSILATGMAAATASPSDASVDAEAGQAVDAEAGSDVGNVAVSKACDQVDSSRGEMACNVLLGVAGVSKYAMLASLVGGPYGYAASILISL